ncbi:MAG: hypothetical protein EHM12_10745, partial [Dehalococcoidia bacterium]
MGNIFKATCMVVFIFTLLYCKKKDPDDDNPAGIVQLVRSRVGTVYLDLMKAVTKIPVDKNLVIEFSNILDTTTVRKSILLIKESTTEVAVNVLYMDDNRTVVLIPRQNLDHFTDYTLEITSSLKGINKETFPGLTYSFTTVNGTMVISNITLNNQSFKPPALPKNISRTSITVTIDFSEALDPAAYKSFIGFSGPGVPLMALSESNKRVTLTNFGTLDYYKRYYLTISGNLTAVNGFNFNG